jgi:hypothetical protein
MPKPEMRKPRPTGDRDTAKMKKQHTDITASSAIREAVATLTIGVLIAVVMWSAILGMSEGQGPGKGLVLGPVAMEVDDDE